MKNVNRFLACYLVVVLIGALMLLPQGVRADDNPDILARSIQSAIDKVQPALVRISVVESYFRDGRETKTETSGSGVIITAEGHVVTNHHVAGDARRITVTLSDKEEIDAVLIGTDALADIAVIKLQPEDDRTFTPAEFGDSSRVRVGDTVLAMGSPVALSQSVTTGIVSNVEMIMPNFMWPFNRLTLDGEDVGSMVRWIGHDARIRGGNSGGPLVNLRGEIIGINEIEFGLSGAIPSNLVQKVARQLIEDGRVVRSWLGLEVQPMLRSAENPEGVLVASVVEGTPAHEAGLRSGDIIRSIGREPVSVRFGEEVPLFNQFVANLSVGEPVEIIYKRDGEEQSVTATTMERPAARPRERELKDWGITARDISLLMAREMDRSSLEGVYVSSVGRGSSASDAKPPIQTGDVIVKVGKIPVNSVKDLAAATEEIMGDSEERVPALVEFERKAERYLTVIRLGQDPLRNPGMEASRAWLPIGFQVLTADVAEALGMQGKTGVRVTEVFKGKSAEEAGIMVGDVITEVDGETIRASQPHDFEVLPVMIRQKNIGDMATLTVWRDGESSEIQVELLPSPKLAREMKRFRSESFEFTARNPTFADQSSLKADEEKSAKGVVVESVEEGGWAAVARLAVGDIILSIQGRKVADVDQLEEYLEEIEEQRPRTVVFHVKRGVRMLFVEILPAWVMD